MVFGETGTSTKRGTGRDPGPGGRGSGRASGRRTGKIKAQASPCLLQASAYALQASRMSSKNWGAGIAMSAVDTCFCLAGIALVPKNIGAQATPCLLQASAYALQASCAPGKIGAQAFAYALQASRCPPKSGAQATPCLLQASAYALQASRLSQKMWRRHRHVCCRHLLLFCRHRVHMEK